MPVKKTPAKSASKSAAKTATKSRAANNASLAPTSAALLDAHVAFVLEQFGKAELPGLLEMLLDTALLQVGDLKLEGVVTRSMIKATARTYAIELDLQGGIPELVGDIARALHAHPVHTRTTLGDLLSQRRFEDLLDHVLALKAIRRRLVNEVIASPLYESIASELLYNGIREYLTHNPVTSGIPGAGAALKLGRAMVSRATAGFEGVVEESLKRQIGRSVRNVSEKTTQSMLDGKHDAALRDAAIASWQRIRRTRLGDWRQDITALDIEELFVTLYECWKELRGTEFMGAMIDAGIDAFFDKYGDSSLAELLEDLGIGRELMLAEALRFAPHVLARLNTAKRLEPLVRAALTPFYASGRVERTLSV